MTYPLSDMPIPTIIAVERAEESLRSGRIPIFVGPGRVGRTMIARRILNLLGRLPNGSQRPFRSPHHTVSPAGIPIEVRRASGGILYLDELPEFSRRFIDSLRYVLGSLQHRPDCLRVRIVASSYPCPCGLAGLVRCQCSVQARERFQSRTIESAELLGIEPDVIEVSSVSLL